MGNCCKGSSQLRQPSEELQLYLKAYVFSSATKSQEESAISYCNKLKNIQNAYITPLSNFNIQKEKLFLSTRLDDSPYSLGKFLEERKATLISSETAQFILAQLCKGIQFLHDNKIIHGDLNPSNIQINPATNAVRIGNMSLPHSIIANTAQGDLGIYYPEYESPEKQKHENLTAKSDGYSLGAIGLALFGVKHESKSTKPLQCPERLFHKLEELMNSDESKRPPLKELLDILENSQNQQENAVGIEVQDEIKSNRRHSTKPQDKLKANPVLNSENIEIQVISQSNTQPKEQQHQQNIPSPATKTTNNQTKVEKQSSQIEKYKDIQKQQTNEDNKEQKEDRQKIEMLLKKQIKEGNMKLKSRIERDSKFNCLVYSDVHKVIIAGSFDGILSMYNISKEGQISEIYKSNPAECSTGISQLLLSQDNKVLFVSLYSLSILVYSVSNQQCKLTGQIQELLTHSLISFDVSANMKQIIVTGANNQAFLYNLNQLAISNKRRITGFSGHSPMCRLVDNKILLCLSTGKVLIYEDSNLSTPIQELAIHSAAITRIAVSPKIISFSSLDGTISLTNQAFSVTQTLSPFNDSVSNVYITKDSQFLASSCWDGVIRIFKVDQSGKYNLIDSFSNLTSWVNDVIYLPDDQTLISIGGSYLSVFK